ncbi:MAG: HEAT repeat domain-containing protein [Planctomycetota bacterium]|nr:HEAT repeat domain-containing protein [Planctomycetota bacterium]
MAMRMTGLAGTVLAILLGAGGKVPGADAAATPPASEPAEAATQRALALIGQLAGPSAKEREEAQRTLVEIGPPALGALKTATDDKDVERATRAKHAIQQIEDAPFLEAVRGGVSPAAYEALAARGLPAEQGMLPVGAGASVDGLQLEVKAAAPAFQQWETIRFALVFRNVGKEDVVLPGGAVTIHVAGQGAQHQQYSERPTGGRIGLVRALAPGESAAVDMVGLFDDTGQWRLGPGLYRLVVSYTPAPSPNAYVPPGRVPGRAVDSAMWRLAVVGNSPVHEKLVPLLELADTPGGHAKARPGLVALGPEADAELLRMLRDPGRPLLPRGTRWAVGARRIRQGVPDLLACLDRQNDDSYLLSITVRALGDMGDAAAINRLAGELPRRGRDVLWALRRIGTPETIPFFRQYADDRDWEIAGQALAGLHVVAGQDVVTGLLDDILAKETPTRQQSHSRLKAMGETATGTLLEAFTTSKDPHRVDTAASFLIPILQAGERTAEINAAIFPRLRSADPDVRLKALEFLCHQDTPEVTAAILAALTDPDERIRQAARGQGSVRKLPEATKALLTLLRDHTKKTDMEGIGLLAYHSEELDAAVLAEFDKGGPEFRQQLVNMVGIFVAHGESTQVSLRWLEKIAADSSLGDMQHVAQHDLRRHAAATQPSGSAGGGR